MMIFLKENYLYIIKKNNNKLFLSINVENYYKKLLLFKEQKKTIYIIYLLLAGLISQ